MQEAYNKATHGMNLLFHVIITKKTYLVCQPSKVNKEYVANGRRRSGLVLI